MLYTFVPSADEDPNEIMLPFYSIHYHHLLRCNNIIKMYVSKYKMWKTKKQGNEMSEHVYNSVFYDETA